MRENGDRWTRGESPHPALRADLSRKRGKVTKSYDAASDSSTSFTQ
jgi:hypothetical protein